MTTKPRLSQDDVDHPGPALQAAGETPPRHHDRYVHYDHQMTDDTAESAARVLIRGVPLVYGALLGGLVGSIPLGLAFGLLLTLMLDLRMGEQSLFRPLVRLLLRPACPGLSRLLRGVSGVLVRLGVPVSALDLHCKT